jgi:4-carboxymuconolactone decarboxylase
MSNPYADIAPALGEYTDKVLFGDLWKRPGLSPRDRSLVTVATLIRCIAPTSCPFIWGAPSRTVSPGEN